MCPRSLATLEKTMGRRPRVEKVRPPSTVACHPLARAAVVFCIGAVVEGSQYLGIPLFGRTFDPVDLLMYAAGATAALGFERLAFSAPGRSFGSSPTIGLTNR